MPQKYHLLQMLFTGDIMLRWIFKRKQVKEQEKEIRRLKKENDFLEEAGAFSLRAV